MKTKKNVANEVVNVTDNVVEIAEGVAESVEVPEVEVPKKSRLGKVAKIAGGIALGMGALVFGAKLLFKGDEEEEIDSEYTESDALDALHEFVETLGSSTTESTDETTEE